MWGVHGHTIYHTVRKTIPDKPTSLSYCPQGVYINVNNIITVYCKGWPNVLLIEYPSITQSFDPCTKYNMNICTNWNDVTWYTIPRVEWQNQETVYKQMHAYIYKFLIHLNLKQHWKTICCEVD